MNDRLLGWVILILGVLWVLAATAKLLSGEPLEGTGAIAALHIWVANLYFRVTRNTA